VQRREPARRAAAVVGRGARAGAARRGGAGAARAAAAGRPDRDRERHRAARCGGGRAPARARAVGGAAVRPPAPSPGAAGGARGGRGRGQGRHVTSVPRGNEWNDVLEALRRFANVMTARAQYPAGHPVIKGSVTAAAETLDRVLDIVPELIVALVDGEFVV